MSPRAKVRTPARPPLRRVRKPCPVCGTEFTPRIGLMRPRKVTQSHSIGVVVCSAACSERFVLEQQASPLSVALSGSDAFPATSQRRCRKCKTTLSEATRFVFCRICRVNRAVWAAVRREAARDERLAKTLAAERVFLMGDPVAAPQPVETLLW